MVSLGASISSAREEVARRHLVQDGTQDDLELVGHVGIVDVEVVLQIGRFEVACDLQHTPVSN